MTQRLVDRVSQLERKLRELQVAARDNALPAGVNLAGLGRRLERCAMTENAGPGEEGTAKLLDQEDEEWEHREITVENTSELWPLTEGQKLDVAWRQLPGERTGKWIPIGGVGPRILRVTLTEDLEIGETAQAFDSGGDEYTVTDEDDWPIKNGTEVTIIASWDPDAEDVIWVPLKAKRYGQTLVDALCCGDETTTVCDLTLQIDSNPDLGDECECRPGGGEGEGLAMFAGDGGGGGGDGFGAFALFDFGAGVQADA